ncbi:MAG: ABC transporter substrate-binding protein [Thermomicrobiales bacterium]
MYVSPSRRQILGAALALGLGGHRAFAQATPEAMSPLPAELPSGGIQPDGTWAFTDDLGFTVTADQAPTKVVAHIGMAAALYDFGFEVIGYFNPATDADGKPLRLAGDLPLDRLTHVGDFGEIDIELLLSIGADLFVGQNYGVETGGMWPFDDAVLATIKQAVPVLSFAYGDDVTIDRNIVSIENLAVALGADATSGAAERDGFLAATEELRTAIAEKPGLTTLFMSGSDTGFWVESAGGADTRYYRTLGMSIYPELASGEVSWEGLLEYEADIIFVDDRAPNWWTPEQIAAEVPTWDFHPAVIADQVAPWRAQFISSYKGFTPVLTEVAGWIRKADDTIY